jgi:hypothetical protein
MHPFARIQAGKPALLPWQTLKAALALTTGGAIYDGSVGVTQSSGVTAWSDALGNAPSLTAQGTGTNPTYSAGAVGAVIVNQGQKVLETATASAQFDTSTARSVALVMSIGALSGVNVFGLAEGAGGFTRLLGLQATSGAYAGYFQGTKPSISVTPNATVRLVIVSAGAGNVNLDIPNQARATLSQAAAAAGNNFLTLGSYQVTGAEVTAAFLGVVVLPRVVTSPDITALKAYATAKGYTAA